MAKPGQTEPLCCQDNGFFWDEAILFPPKGLWQDAPVSIFWNGPVWKIIASLERAVGDQLFRDGESCGEVN
jgi:hypothetical protein